MALPLTIALTHDPVAGFGAFGATALAAYLAARGIYRQVRRSRERDLINLVDELAAEIMG